MKSALRILGRCADRVALAAAMYPEKSRRHQELLGQLAAYDHANRMVAEARKDAVQWIAYNDEPGCSDALVVRHVAGLVTVCLVADLFGVPARDIAREVVKYRKEDR